MKKSAIRTSLILLLTLIPLASCIVTDPTLGAALVPGNQNISIRTATLDLPVDLRMADSLQSSISQSATVGAIRSRTFGLFHSDVALSVTAAKDSVEWGANPTVRSVSLELIRDTSMVVDPSQIFIPQNYYVHQLTVDLDSTKIYNNSIGDGDYDPVPISEGVSLFLGGDSYTVTLKKEIGEKLLAIPTATRDSAELFMKAFRGFYIRCDDPEEGMYGGRLCTFDLSSSYLRLVWDFDDTDGNRKSGTAFFSLGQKHVVNRFISGSRDLEHADITQNLYMEGLNGIKPHIDARKLRDAVTSWAAASGLSTDKLLIAKATVSFPFEYDGDRDQFNYYPSSLFPCQRVQKEKRLNYTPIDEINDVYLENGEINRSLLQYTANISLYLQDLITRDREELTGKDDLWMMPILSYYDSYSSKTYYYSDYYNYTQSVLNGTAAERHPVLQLTFAVLD